MTNRTCPTCGSNTPEFMAYIGAAPIGWRCPDPFHTGVEAEPRKIRDVALPSADQIDAIDATANYKLVHRVKDVSATPAPKPQLEPTDGKLVRAVSEHYWGKDWPGEYPLWEDGIVTDDQRADLMALYALLAAAKAVQAYKDSLKGVTTKNTTHYSHDGERDE